MSLTFASFSSSHKLRGSERRICRSKLLQGISRIKPQMMKKVLSSISRQHRQLSDHKPSQTPESSRLMELFPSHKCDNESERYSKPLLHSTNERSDPGFLEQQKPKLSQLTIFYKGEVNIYNVPQPKAQEIMEFADSSLNKKPKIQTNIERDLSFAVNETEKHASPCGGLVQVRQQSLQRFLEKRHNRLNRPSPFSRAATLKPDKTVLEDLNLSLVL